MRAWIQAIAFVCALLLGNSAVLADAPIRAASANDGAAMSVDAGRDVAGGSSNAGQADDVADRNLRDLVFELRGGQSAAPSEAAALPATDNSQPAAGADAEADAPLRSSRESRSLGPTFNQDGDASNSDLFAGTGSMVLNTLTALGVVIGLILLLRWGWTKVSGQPTINSSPAVEVLARTPVAPRNHILLVRIGNRILIVGDSAAGLRTLATVDDPEEIADLLTTVTAARDNSISRSFGQLLGRFQGDYDPEAVDAAETAFSRRTRFEEGGDRSEHVVDRARDSMSGLMSRLRHMAPGKGGRS